MHNQYFDVVGTTLYYKRTSSFIWCENIMLFAASNSISFGLIPKYFLLLQKVLVKSVLWKEFIIKEHFMCLLVIRSVMFFFANHSQNRNVNIRLVFLKEVAYSILPILLQAICKNICLLQNILKRSYSLNEKF